MKILVPGKCDTICLVPAWIGHEPESHFDDDAETRLGEDAVVVGSEAVVEQLPAFVRFLLVRRCVWVSFGIRQGAHAGADQVSVRQDDLETRVHHPVIAVRSVPDTAFDGVADDRPAAEVWHVQPHAVPELVLLEIVVQVEEGDSGLHESEGAVDIHFEDPVHVAAEIEANATGHAWTGTAVSYIPSDRKGPDRDLELVAQAHDGLDIGHASRCDDGGADEVFAVEDMVHVVDLAGLQVAFML